MNIAHGNTLKLICGLQQFEMYGKNTRDEEERKANKIKCIDILKSLSFNNKYFQRTQGSLS